MIDDHSVLSVRKSFNVALSTSLVHLYPDPNNVECLMGRGFAFQYARKWDEAVPSFSRVCRILTEESRERIRAQEE